MKKINILNFYILFLWISVILFTLLLVHNNSNDKKEIYSSINKSNSVNIKIKSIEKENNIFIIKGLYNNTEYNIRSNKLPIIHDYSVNIYHIKIDNQNINYYAFNKYEFYNDEFIKFKMALNKTILSTMIVFGIAMNLIILKFKMDLK